MGPMLIDETFVAVFPSLVRRLGGMNEAAVLQAIHFRSQIESRTFDGEPWTPMTAAEIGRSTGLSEDAAFRALAALRADGVLIGEAKEAHSRRMWWRIDLERLFLIPSRDSAETHAAGSRRPSRESAESTTTKKIEEEPKKVIAIAHKVGTDAIVKAFVDKFKELHGADPDRGSIGRLAREAKRMLIDGRPRDDVEAAAIRCAEDGHANLPAALTRHLAKGSRQPKGFAGIKAFLEDDREP